MPPQLVADIEIVMTLSNVEATLGTDAANLLRNRLAALTAQVAGLSEDLERTRIALAISDVQVANAAWA